MKKKKKSSLVKILRNSVFQDSASMSQKPIEIRDLPWFLFLKNCLHKKKTESRNNENARFRKIDGREAGRAGSDAIGRRTKAEAGGGIIGSESHPGPLSSVQMERRVSAFKKHCRNSALVGRIGSSISSAGQTSGKSRCAISRCAEKGWAIDSQDRERRNHLDLRRFGDALRT